MGIFTRMADIVKANINDFLDKAEDPEKMIKQMVIEMEEAVNKATTAVGTAIANQKRLEKQFNENKKLADEWQNKAV
ncbi:MAG TPA: PspA/IM30 family protein, partial [bacterium]|nr:PspA/IM30 family protein [bacterium]